mmetsp:Transcript_16352/g.53240  ORF Transcript_16352/g.53240 Transcript_16352/m.53240 type:complete len:189 (-) Transcript_16352:221-787(-)
MGAPHERVVASASSLCQARVRDVKVIGVKTRGIIMIRPYVFAPPTVLPQRQHGLYGVSRRFAELKDPDDVEGWLLDWAEKRLAERHNLSSHDVDDADTVVYSLAGDIADDDLQDVPLQDDDDDLSDTDTETSIEDDDESPPAFVMFANHAKAIAFNADAIALSCCAEPPSCCLRRSGNTNNKSRLCCH